LAAVFVGFFYQGIILFQAMMTDYPNFSVLLRVALIILLGLRQEGELHAESNSRDQARSKQSNMLSMKSSLASKSLLAVLMHAS
jgi:hypothetical protein